MPFAFFNYFFPLDLFANTSRSRITLQLERLAYAITNKGCSPASPLQTLVRRHWLRSLLIDATFVFDPSRRVMPIWVAMCPVNRSALFVPFIFAKKTYFVANLERDNSRCEVNIVGNQDCLARFEFNDKSLMSIPVVIVRQEPTDPTRSLHLKIALVLIECASQPLVTLANGAAGIDRGRRRASAECGETKNPGKQSEFHMRLVKYFNS